MFPVGYLVVDQYLESVQRNVISTETQIKKRRKEEKKKRRKKKKEKRKKKKGLLLM